MERNRAFVYSQSKHNVNRIPFFCFFLYRKGGKSFWGTRGLRGELQHFGPIKEIWGSAAWLQIKVHYSNPSETWWRHKLLYCCVGKEKCLSAASGDRIDLPIRFTIDIQLKTQVWGRWVTKVSQRAQVNREGFTRASGTKKPYLQFSCHLNKII